MELVGHEQSIMASERGAGEGSAKTRSRDTRTFDARGGGRLSAGEGRRKGQAGEANAGRKSRWATWWDGQSVARLVLGRSDPGRDPVLGRSR